MQLLYGSTVLDAGSILSLCCLGLNRTFVHKKSPFRFNWYKRMKREGAISLLADSNGARRRSRKETLDLAAELFALRAGADADSQRTVEPQTAEALRDFLSDMAVTVQVLIT